MIRSMIILSLAHRAVQKSPPSVSPWFHGRVGDDYQNLYDLGIFNGDIGICLWGSSGLSVYFEGRLCVWWRLIC